jgi:hypothetical protein
VVAPAGLASTFGEADDERCERIHANSAKHPTAMNSAILAVRRPSRDSGYGDTCEPCRLRCPGRRIFPRLVEPGDVVAVSASQSATHVPRGDIWQRREMSFHPVRAGAWMTTSRRRDVDLSALQRRRRVPWARSPSHVLRLDQARRRCGSDYFGSLGNALGTGSL